MKKLLLVLLFLLTACAPAPGITQSEVALNAVATWCAGGNGLQPYSMGSDGVRVYCHPPVTQTPHIVVVTATPEVKITETLIFTLEPTVSCPPALFSRMTLGHIPGLDIGDKKSPVVVSINCSVIAILLDGAKITGVLSEDGRVVLNCQMSYDNKDYPCELQIPVLAMDNPYLQANGWMFKKASKELICLAETNTSYAGFCE